MAIFTSMARAGLQSQNSTMNITPAPIAYTDNITIYVGNNTTNHDDDHHPQFSTTFMAAYFSIRLLFSGFAIFGNMLTIVAVIRFEHLQNMTNFLICSLAAANMLSGSLTPIVIMQYMLPDDPFFVPLCLTEKILGIISLGTTLVSIMWIAIDRYIYIAHGLHYHIYVTKTRTFIVIGLTWLYIVTQVTTVFMLTHHLEIGMTCMVSVFLSSLGYSKILMPQVGVYAGMTVIFYIAIGRIAYKQGRAIAALNQPYDTYEAAGNRQQKKIAKMMVTVLGTYFTCHSPQVIISVILKSSRTPFWLHVEKMTIIIYMCHTWLNPIIYAWKSQDFRIAFRKLLGIKPSNMATPIAIPMVPQGGVNI